MERLVKGRLITHLVRINLIGHSQYGFRNKRSYLTSLLDFFSQVIDTYEADNDKAVDLVYLDFQKAFDMVPHERLMVKVNAHGPNQPHLIIYLDTWRGLEAAKTAPWPSRELHHFGKFLEPSDE